MKNQTKLYNIILPIWLLVLFPQVWLIVIPGNLIIDCAVLLLTLGALRHTEKKAVLKKVWWKLWLLGFLSDFVGILWMLLGLICDIPTTPFRSPLSFLWTFIAIVFAGVCIYFFDKRAMRSCEQLTAREQHLIALVMAIVTAPWTFLIPMY